MDRIVSVASSIYGLDLYFCFIDFTIRFTDLMLFLSPYIDNSHDTSLQTITFGQDRFSSIIHLWIRPICLLHGLYDTLC